MATSRTLVQLKVDHSMHEEGSQCSCSSHPMQSQSNLSQCFKMLQDASTSETKWDRKFKSLQHLWTRLATSCKPLDIWYAKQETVLEEHSDNRHHCQTAICKFSTQFGLLCCRVRDLAQESRESNLIFACLRCLNLEANFLTSFNFSKTLRFLWFPRRFTCSSSIGFTSTFYIFLDLYSFHWFNLFFNWGEQRHNHQEFQTWWHPSGIPGHTFQRRIQIPQSGQWTTESAASQAPRTNLKSTQIDWQIIENLLDMQWCGSTWSTTYENLT